MKRLFGLFALTLLPLPSLWAQVSVELVMDEDRWVAGGPVIVGVRVTNLSGQTLHFGETSDWVTFAVESRENFIVSRLGQVDAKGEFEVESAKMATRRLDLAPAYELTMPGRYTVTATVLVPQWGKQLVTEPKKFEIIAGAKIWEQAFGVPNPDGSTAPPEERKYALIRARQLRQTNLYLRLTDKTESKILRVVSLGEMVSLSNPEHELDKMSQLHVLWQTAARSGRAFNYTVLNPQGDVIRRETHDYTTTRPVLKFDKNGNVAVAGGTRRLTPTDLPPVDRAAPGSDAKAAGPAP